MNNVVIELVFLQKPFFPSWFFSKLFGAELFLGIVLMSGSAFAVVPRFAYVVNAYDSTISTYTINAATGQLRHTGHVRTQKFPSAVIAHPSGRFVYAAAQTGMAISAFKVDPNNGRLTEIEGSPFDPKIVSPFWLAIDGAGKFLYMAARNSNNVAVMTIDQKTGTLKVVPGSPYPGGELPRAVTVHPSGQYVYMTNINHDTVSAYRVQDKTGALTEIKGSPFAAGDAPQFMRFNPAGNYAFLSNWNSKNIIVYQVDSGTGALQKKHVVSLDTEVFPFGLSLHPAGRYLYVANWFGGPVGFSIDQESGSLTPLSKSPFMGKGRLPVQIEVESAGTFAYVTNYESNHVTAYAIDKANGELTAADTVMARAGPRAITIIGGDKPIEYVPRFAYIVNSGANSITGFLLNPATGAMESIGVFPTGAKPQGIAADPQGKFLYVTNTESNSVSAYRINEKTGVLNEVPGSPYASGKNPTSIAVDYNGRAAYVTNHDSNTVSVFRIQAETGALSELKKTPLYGNSPFPVAPLPGTVRLHPAERFAYVMHRQNNKMTAYKYYDDGPLVVEVDRIGSPFTMSDNPVDMAMDPTGKFAYVLDGKASTLAAYALHEISGEMKAINAKPLATGKNPVAVTVHPSGRFVYVANNGSDDLSIYGTNTDTGILKETQRIKVSKRPTFISLDASGQFAYILSEGSENVTAYRVNAHTGELSVLGAMPVGAKPVAMTVTTSIR